MKLTNTRNCRKIRGIFIEELKGIREEFTASGRELISIPVQQRLEGKADKTVLISTVIQADEECGGCEFDPLYKQAMELIG